MSKKRIGLIAGNGSLPLLFAESVKAKGYTVFAVAHEKETDPTLAQKVDDLLWVSIGQIEPIFSYFKKQDISETVMAGGIPKRYLLEVQQDDKIKSLLAPLPSEKKDDLLLRAFASELERNHIKVVSVTNYLPSLLAPEGEMTRSITPEERSDIEWGWSLAKRIGALDIGQSVVVKVGVILAVEAIEGTDAAILRGGQLAPFARVIKCKKPHQDTRFDLPTVGPKTIETMIAVKASVLVIEAHATLMLDKPVMLDIAQKADIAIVGWQEENDGPLSG